MRTLFGSIRKENLTQNKAGKYLLYALGEILLVVIGILIALTIDNWNDARKQRALEIHYLKNIKVDLNLTINDLNAYIDNRTQLISNANTILAYSEGKPITNADSLNVQLCMVYSWRKFNQSNNTFQELTNSGNLTLISNDSIKTMLLNLESQYKLVHAEEEHFRFDSEVLLYEPLYRLLDTNPVVDNFTWVVTSGQAGKKSPLSIPQFEKFLKDTKVKNGFVMTKLEFGIMNPMFINLKAQSEQLVRMIDRELKK